MTLVSNETEQALNRQYDVYAAAREEYRKKIEELAAEVEKLRAALKMARPFIGWAGYHPTILAVVDAALEEKP